MKKAKKTTTTKKVTPKKARTRKSIPYSKVFEQDYNWGGDPLNEKIRSIKIPLLNKLILGYVLGENFLTLEELETVVHTLPKGHRLAPIHIEHECERLTYHLARAIHQFKGGRRKVAKYMVDAKYVKTLRGAYDWIDRNPDVMAKRFR